MEYILSFFVAIVIVTILNLLDKIARNLEEQKRLLEKINLRIRYHKNAELSDYELKRLAEQL